MNNLILASQNRGKQAEMEALLRELPLQLTWPQDLQQQLVVHETGEDYAANATLKAHAFATTFNHWALGDDTGLEVDALDGAPGLHSARLVGVGGNDADRRQRLLEMLADHQRPWKARFVCVVALASPDGEIYLQRGECLGEIIPDERGEAGFGYDSIFLVKGTDKTMAELTMEQKNQLSHRARAVTALLSLIQDKLGLP
jgi:XTP/dITP diphosphohydrolase